MNNLPFLTFKDHENNSRYDHWNKALFRIQSGYSKSVLEDEKIIASNVFGAYCYAIEIDRRFLLGEKVISKDEVYSFLYYKNILEPQNIKLRKNSRIFRNYKKQMCYEIMENVLLI